MPPPPLLLLLRLGKICCSYCAPSTLVAYGAKRSWDLPTSCSWPGRHGVFCVLRAEICAKTCTKTCAKARVVQIAGCLQDELVLHFLVSHPQILPAHMSVHCAARTRPFKIVSSHQRLLSRPATSDFLTMLFPERPLPWSMESTYIDCGAPLVGSCCESILKHSGPLCDTVAAGLILAENFLHASEPL